MSTPVRLLTFAAALAAVFALALVGARILLPADLAQAGQDRTDHSTSTSSEDDHEKDSQMDHTSAPTPSAQHSENSHESSHAGHGQTSAADPVRGLAAAADGYQLEALTAPIRTDQGGVLAFRLTGPDGSPVTGYTTSHDKDLHLIVVRSDGRQFRHVHPAHDGNGGWSLPWRWEAAGSYRVFADFVPTATGQPLTLTGTADVAGVLTPAPVGKDSVTTTVDKFTVTTDGALRAGRESMLTFTVTRDSRLVTTLQPYLGAAGHLVALRAGDLAYLHVHPMGGEPAAASGPDIDFMVTAPSPGRYLLYLDFQVDGRVHTAPFAVTASR